MAIALSLDSKEYILECDRDLEESQQTIFYIKPLSAKEQANIQDSIKFTDGETTTVANFGTHSLNLLKAGLTGWKNFLDAEGNQIKFLSKDPEGNLNKIPAEYRYELAAKIMSMSSLSDNQVKN